MRLTASKPGSKSVTNVIVECFLLDWLLKVLRCSMCVRTIVRVVAFLKIIEVGRVNLT